MILHGQKNSNNSNCELIKCFQKWLNHFFSNSHYCNNVSDVFGFDLLFNVRKTGVENLITCPMAALVFMILWRYFSKMDHLSLIITMGKTLQRKTITGET